MMAGDKVEKSVDTLSRTVDLPMGEPEEVGMSSERLGRIRTVMQSYVDRQLVPGVVSLVARDGKIVYLDSVGMRDVNAGAPMTDDTIFRIMSMTKPITSVALMMLYEEGHFLLSSRIKKWIPEFADPQVIVPVEPGEYSAFPHKTVPAARPITILHLLTHTAGLANQLRGTTTKEFVEIQKPQSPDETIGDFVKRLARMPLNFHPGEAWEYSRATCVIGHLVEIISGMPLDEFFKKRIFEPLGMRDTHFFLPTEKLDRFAAAYTPGKDRKIQLIDAATEKSRWVREPHVFFMGSGGLVSTVADYFRFNQMMLNDGELDGARILGRKTVELMTRNHIGGLPVSLTGPWSGFGLGYAIVKRIDEVEQLTCNQQGPIPWSEGSYTWGGMYCTYSWNDPVEQLTGVLMTQVWPYQHLMIRQDFVGLANQAIVD